MNETVLIVDDEDSVRRTFQEWLSSAGWPVRVFAVADAEAALLLANEQSIDLAVLDWNLGSGSDGLKLLEDLIEFQPEIVAILVTGFANQATPLDALRMGVRDYLDKNHDLTRDTFLRAVRKQLDRLGPLKRQRELNRSLAAFRESVEKILPLVRGASALNEPIPLPSAIHAFLRFLIQATGAKDGVLILSQQNAEGNTHQMGYDAAGQAFRLERIPFALSIASSVLNFTHPCIVNDFQRDIGASAELYSHETMRTTLLAAPLTIGTKAQAVIELFDKPEFTPEDSKLVASISEIGVELLRHALMERQTQRMLFDAVEAALKASDGVSETLNAVPSETPPQAVMDRLRFGFAESQSLADADRGLRLVEAIRTLAVHHGTPAIDHCITLVTSLKKLLDESSGLVASQ